MDKNKPYTFSNKYFTVTIYARSLVGAIDKYRLFFGDMSFNSICVICSPERDE